MGGDSDIAAVAGLIGDETRARMLSELLGGRSLRAGELATAADVSRATASHHLQKLLGAGLLAVEAEGRGRSYRLADHRVAEALEALQRLAPRQEVRSLRAANKREALTRARLCYDHLAGRLAIDLVDAMEASGLMRLDDDRFELSPAGVRKLNHLGIDPEALRAQRRSYSRACLDWTERRPHLAGALGAGLAGRVLELGWVARIPNGRALEVTAAGRTGFAEAFGVGA